MKGMSRKYLANPSAQKYVKKIVHWLQSEYSFVYDTVVGRAKGAGVDLDTYIYYLCTEFRQQQEEHCTSIIVNTSKNKFIAHNEDEDCDKNLIKLIKYSYADGRKFIELGYADALEGTSIHLGKNFVFSMNYIWMNEFNLNYMPMHFYNKILCNAKSANEFFEIIKTLPIASATGFNFCDLETKKLYYIEKALDKFDIKEISGVNIHANHLLAKDLKHFVPPIKEMGVGNTLNRQMVAESLLNGRKDLTSTEALEILSYYGTCDYNSVMSKRNSDYDCLTFGTFIYDVKSNTAKIYVYNKNKDILELKL